MDPNTPQPGSIIAGKYRVERALGAGGMGVVLHATHIALNQGVALKLLHEGAAQNPEMVARFLREGQIAAQLPPEHVARVIDVGQTEAGAPYLVMELLTGRDVAAELAQRGTLPVAEAVDIVLQASQGVAEAHAVGLVHRDLKPANLFLAARRGEPPVVKVLDFGLSKSFDGARAPALTQTTSNFGTPAYMSPEQIRSAKYVDARSDQHSLGMILFELLTGHAPYDAESLTGLAVVISTTPPPHARAERREVPEALDAAICKALAKRQPDRYPTLAGFAAAIAPFGGPTAKAMAARIAAILDPAGRSSLAPVLGPAGTATGDLGTARTVKENTHAPTVSDPGRKKPARMTLFAAAALASSAVLLVGAALLVARSTGNSTGPSSTAPPASPSVITPSTEPTSSPAAAPSAAPADGPSTDANPIVTAAPTSAPVIASPSSVPQPPSAAPSVSSTALSIPHPTLPSPAPKQTPKTGKRPRDVFGGDK